MALSFMGLATAACGDEAGGTADSPGRDGERQVQRVTVTATDFGFEQNGIELEPGEIEVTLVNKGKVQHSLASHELGFDIVASPGEETSTTFSLPAGETFPFGCKFHPDEMRGAIYVIRE